MKLEYKIFNPEQNNYSYYCLTCEAYLPEDEFYESAIKNSTKRCKKCFCRIVSETRKKNNNYYRKVLGYLRRIEHKRGSKVHLEESDVLYLVTKVWKEKSCISKSTENLTLISWKKEHNNNIYPWNCILVTKKEARKHNDLKESLQNYYPSELVSKIDKKLKKVENELIRKLAIPN